MFLFLDTTIAKKNYFIYKERFGQKDVFEKKRMDWTSGDYRAQTSGDYGAQYDFVAEEFRSPIPMFFNIIVPCLENPTTFVSICEIDPKETNFMDLLKANASPQCKELISFTSIGQCKEIVPYISMEDYVKLYLEREKKRDDRGTETRGCFC